MKISVTRGERGGKEEEEDRVEHRVDRKRGTMGLLFESRLEFFFFLFQTTRVEKFHSKWKSCIHYWTKIEDQIIAAWKRKMWDYMRTNFIYETEREEQSWSDLGFYFPLRNINRSVKPLKWLKCKISKIGPTYLHPVSWEKGKESHIVHVNYWF